MLMMKDQDDNPNKMMPERMTVSRLSIHLHPSPPPSLLILLIYTYSLLFFILLEQDVIQMY